MTILGVATIVAIRRAQARDSGRLSARQAASPPRSVNAWVKPWAVSWRTAAAPRRAGVVVHDDRLFLVLLQGVAGLQQLLAVHLPGAGQVAGLELLRAGAGRAPAAPWFMRRMSSWGETATLAFRTGAHFVYQDERHEDRGGGGQPGVMTDEFEHAIHGGGGPCRGRKKGAHYSAPLSIRHPARGAAAGAWAAVLAAAGSGLPRAAPARDRAETDARKTEAAAAGGQGRDRARHAAR